MTRYNKICSRCKKPASESAKEFCKSCFFDRGRILLSKTTRTDSCWIYKGSYDRDGYGKLGRNGRAHRVSYEIYKGRIPVGSVVCHTCDNPPCVNPEHLWIGDNRRNIHDAMDKKRFQFGKTNGRAKLTDVDIRWIRMNYRNRLGAVIARRFGIGETQVRRIAKGEQWKHI